MSYSELLQKPLAEIITEGDIFKDELPFDQYHLMMAATDVLENIQDTNVTKTYFYRRAPFSASYSVFAGLSALLSKLSSFSYKSLIPYLEKKQYDQKFIDYIKSRDKLKLKVYSMPENTLAFESEPIATFECPLIDARIIEGMVLSELNFATLSATKWHRIVNAANSRPVSEFGRRRAQNALKSSLYAHIAGATNTSNCEAEQFFGIATSGTMGHEFVQSFESEFEAFDTWLKFNPTRPCLLVDTISTLDSGIMNACKAYAKHKQTLVDKGVWQNIAVRLDSGDLAYLAVCCYDYLSKHLETNDITIVLSNDLDEYSIESIFSQLSIARRQDVADRLSFGVGTKGAVAWGEPAFNGVCKLSEIDGKSIIKLSNQSAKTTIPGNIRSANITNNNGEYVTTLIYLANENIDDIDALLHPNDVLHYIKYDRAKHSPIAPKQHLIYRSDGTNSEFLSKYARQSITEIKQNSKEILDTLDWSYKRNTNSHVAKVSLSPKLFSMRSDMIKSGIFKA